MRTKRRLASALQQWHNFFQEGEQSQMVGSIANRAITDLIREGNTEGLRNFLASRKSHVDDKDEVMFRNNFYENLFCLPWTSFTCKLAGCAVPHARDSQHSKVLHGLHIIVKEVCGL